jgi:hypothetical protein
LTVEPAPASLYVKDPVDQHKAHGITRKSVQSLVEGTGLGEANRFTQPHRCHVIRVSILTSVVQPVQEWRDA